MSTANEARPGCLPRVIVFILGPSSGLGAMYTSRAIAVVSGPVTSLVSQARLSGLLPLLQYLYVHPYTCPHPLQQSQYNTTKVRPESPPPQLVYLVTRTKTARAVGIPHAPVAHSLRLRPPLADGPALRMLHGLCPVLLLAAAAAMYTWVGCGLVGRRGLCSCPCPA